MKLVICSSFNNEIEKCKGCPQSQPHVYNPAPCPAGLSIAYNQYQLTTDRLARPIISTLKEMLAAKIEQYESVKVVCPGCNSTLFRSLHIAERILLYGCINHKS